MEGYLNIYAWYSCRVYAFPYILIHYVLVLRYSKKKRKEFSITRNP